MYIYLHSCCWDLLPCVPENLCETCLVQSIEDLDWKEGTTSLTLCQNWRSNLSLWCELRMEMKRENISQYH